MFWTILFIILETICADCTRPTDYHWMTDESPTNTSIELFSGNSGTIERVYLNFGHSQCYSAVAGDYYVHCGGKTMAMSCSNFQGHDKKEVGLAQQSPLWDHYTNMVFDNQRIILGQYKTTYSEKCQTIDSNTFCRLGSSDIKYQYNGNSRTEQFPIQLFSSTRYTKLPNRIFKAFEESINRGKYDEVWIKIKIGGKEWKCGDECLFSHSFTGGFELWAEPNDEDIVVLNERFLHYKRMKYNAYTRSVEFDEEYVYVDHRHKIVVQLLLLPKIFYGFWVFTRRKELHCDPEKQELFYEIIDIITLALIMFEELVMHNKNQTQLLITIVFVSWFVVVKVYEYGVHDKRTKQANFEACIVIGHLIPIFIIQTMVQELDSYECVVIGVTLQTGLIINDLLETMFMWNGGNYNEYVAKTIFLIFGCWIVYYNYTEWLSVFFDEIVSLLGYDKRLFVVCFYNALLFVVIESWKRRKLFTKIKFI